MRFWLIFEAIDGDNYVLLDQGPPSGRNEYQGVFLRGVMEFENFAEVEVVGRGWDFMFLNMTVLVS